MREEDVRPGTGINKISAEGRGPLNFGEREALAMQHRNALSVGKTWEDNERDRMRALTTDAALKQPRFPTLKYGG